MNRLILAAALAAGCTLASSAPALAAAKNYDCTKAGNANKAACKSATPAAPVAKQTTVATSTRHYDCTKPGNANRQECKVSTASSQTTTQPTLMQRMKSAVTGTSAPAAKPALAARPVAAPRKTAAAPASVEDHNPSGAIAQCKDGTYSHAKGRTGACSRHGGVGKWM
jgi:hypothetical protein